jgi:hypothetical protein
MFHLPHADHDHLLAEHTLNPFAQSGMQPSPINRVKLPLVDGFREIEQSVGVAAAVQARVQIQRAIHEPDLKLAGQERAAADRRWLECLRVFQNGCYLEAGSATRFQNGNASAPLILQGDLIGEHWVQRTNVTMWCGHTVEPHRSVPVDQLDHWGPRLLLSPRFTGFAVNSCAG